MSLSGTTWLRRASLVLAALAASWAAAIVALGGVTMRLAGVRVTSNSAVNPTVVAVLTAAVAVWLSRPRILATLSNDVRALVDGARRMSPATYLLIAGIAWRLWFWLLDPPLWLDEEMIALNIRERAFAELPGALWLGQAAPLGWLTAQRLIGLTLGFSELLLRATPVAFSVATLVAAWWAGRRWLSAAGAAVLVFLLSFGEWVLHYSLEVKHYSADVFFGLWLPLLVVWVLEGADRNGRLKRAAAWWIAASVGQFFAIGAVQVAPACAVALVLMLWRRDGLKTAAVAAAFGGGWLVLFGAHYATTLRFVTGSAFLNSVWADQMAPAQAGLAGRLAWLIARAAPLARNPAGASISIAWLVWISAFVGFALARPRRLGVMLALVTMSAAALGLARVTPMYERFTLWALPALYFGVALALDAGVRLAMQRRTASSTSTPSAPMRVSGAVLIAGALIVCVNVGAIGYSGATITHHGDTNHALDDRTLVRWLAAERRPTDVIVTTHLAAPAVWWYGGATLPDPPAITRMGESPIFEIEYHDPHPQCDTSLFERAFDGHARVLFYLGFDNDPNGLSDMIVNRLRDLGSIAKMRRIGNSVAGIVELAAPEPSRPVSPERPCFRPIEAVRW